MATAPCSPGSASRPGPSCPTASRRPQPWACHSAAHLAWSAATPPRGPQPPLRRDLETLAAPRPHEAAPRDATAGSPPSPAAEQAACRHVSNRFETALEVESARAPSSVRAAGARGRQRQRAARRGAQKVDTTKHTTIYCSRGKVKPPQGSPQGNSRHGVVWLRGARTSPTHARRSLSQFQIQCTIFSCRRACHRQLVSTCKIPTCCYGRSHYQRGFERRRKRRHVTHVRGGNAHRARPPTKGDQAIHFNVTFSCEV